MTKDDVLDFFGNPRQTALALNCTRECVVMWKVVPWSRQCEIEVLTKGKLKADPKVKAQREPIVSALIASRKAQIQATKSKKQAEEAAKV